MAEGRNPHGMPPDESLERTWKGEKLKELTRTNDMVRLSFLRALLEDSGIASIVFDANMSITEGNANFISRRLMVGENDYSRAKRLLQDAGVDDA